MLATGFIVFLGVFLIFIKLPVKTSLTWLGRPLLLDVGISALVAALHWGTFSGMMAAAVAGMLCSVVSGSARFVFGYIANRRYYPGRVFNLAHKLKGA